MMNKTKEKEMMVAEELPLAGQPSPVTPKLLKLDSYRITSDTQVQEEEFLMRMYGKPCLPRRDLTAVTGMEKCGKTFFTSMLMACGVECQVLELERIRETPLKVMWYDTEQSRQSTKSILTDRIGKMVTDKAALEDNLLIFNVRACTYQERMEYLETGIEAYHPDLVIIDNVSDLLPSVNDAEESQRVITRLMELATLGNCNIVVVIHVNRSGDKRNLRGWLGTEILHKSFEAFYCQQLTDTDMFSVEQLLTRKFRFSEKMYYTVSDAGLPEESSRPAALTGSDSDAKPTRESNCYTLAKAKADSFNQSYIIRHKSNSKMPWEWDLRKLFTDAMGGCLMMSLEMLREKVMNLSGIQLAGYYEKVFKLAIASRVLTTTLDRSGRVVVIPTPA